MERFAQSARGHTVAEGPYVDTIEAVDAPTLEEDPYQDRRKRRKTNSPPPVPYNNAADNLPSHGSLDWHRQLELEAAPATSSEISPHASEPHEIESVPNTATIAAEPVEMAAILPRNDAPAAGTHTPSEIGPTPTTEQMSSKKKTMKVSKSGKLTSSPPQSEVEPPKKRRGRKPKLKVLPTVTIIKYGQDLASRRVFGEKIEAILNSQKPVARPATLKKAPPRPTGPPKPTHPFFLGKAAAPSDQGQTGGQNTQIQAISSPKPQKTSACTPGKLKLESRNLHANTNRPAFGPRGSREAKQSGLIEAFWPAKDIAHVRNLDEDVHFKPRALLSEIPLKTRKLKSSVLAIPHEEDLLEKLAIQLQPAIQRQRNLHEDEDEFASPQDVRLPSRLLTTGVALQNEIRTQVPSLNTPSAHPATSALFADTEHTFTAFDLGQCEPLSWVQKYAPQCASHVLQSGRESLVFKDWLQNLTVLSVSGQHAGSKAADVSDAKKPPKKKRKKARDDFIVDSDEEEEEEMVELPREEPFMLEARSPAPVSFRRVRWTRNKNVVVISGPHGCGKSAMVSAVAKDLGFEIFEIHSGSRRSGKDIQDKVGDMTENHLVSHKRKEAVDPKSTPVADADGERNSDALQKDLDSGRQGTMMSFFKTKDIAKEKPESEPKGPEPKGPEPQKPASSTQAMLPIVQPKRKSQKQSLILLEEADILYDEDQGFWPQVTKLAALSKRPIVITCTNEALIPMHELPLAAVLRLSPPPVSLATDYLVALAGREGHLLGRDAVSSLYQSKNCDLRASITELNMWCQMSVGDRKGGLEWIYQRWPPGKDLDESGRPLRVASVGTYAAGMGCVSHNVFNSQDNVGYDRTAELLQESWQEWRINPTEWTGDHHEDISDGATSNNLLEELERFDMIAESLSAMDAYCSIDLPSYSRYCDQPTDPSLPEITDKARLNYTLAAPVLQVDHITDFSHLDADLQITTHLLTRRAFGKRDPSTSATHNPLPSTEAALTAAILRTKAHQFQSQPLTRPAFSLAFDLLAFTPDSAPALNTSYNLTASSFDRTFNIVVEDLAPYVRSIVANELVLENQRIRLGNLLSEGGTRTGKRQRTTRAARTALEGGSRDTKRREHWFNEGLNRVLVMGTAGKAWAGLGSVVEVAGTETETESRTGSLAGTQEDGGEGVGNA